MLFILDEKLTVIEEKPERGNGCGMEDGCTTILLTVKYSQIFFFDPIEIRNCVE